MTAIKSSELSIAQLSVKTKKEMYTLFAQYYQNTRWEVFVSDLAEKQSVFMFQCRKTGKILGFSTIYRRREFIPDAGFATFIFSGDTVMDRKIWGSKCLQVAFFSYIFRAKIRRPFEPVYWMLMSKGFKTYMMMRRNFASSYPAANKAMPPLISKAQQYFYRRKFGERYFADRHIIQYDSAKDYVRQSFACLPEQQNEDVAFFAATNPGFERGDELACIAEIRFGDFPQHLSKYIFKPFKRLLPQRKTATIVGTAESSS